MSKLLDETLARVAELPSGEQDGVALAVIEYLEERKTATLTDEQLAEVQRRRTDPDQVLVSHEDATEYIKRLIS
jgi:hypothetical protein